MAENDDKPETITTTIEIDKDTFLKFKALCVLKEKTISGEIEALIRKSVEGSAGTVEEMMAGQ